MESMMRVTGQGVPRGVAGHDLKAEWHG